MRKATPPYLRIVPATESKKPASAYETGAPRSQGTLFADHHPWLIVFQNTDASSDEDLLAILRKARPKYVFDVRSVPRFDIGKLSRRAYFECVREVGAKYFDLALAGGRSPSDLSMDAFASSELFRERAFKAERLRQGPVLVIHDSRQAKEAFAASFVKALEGEAPNGWEVLRMPTLKEPDHNADRTVLFISHATPNDNEFARWLGTKLELEGYEVWLDFNQLAAGESFWDDIENVIRTKAAKVLVAASSLAQSRNGVLDEINLAVSVERSQGIPNFVVPMRIDETPYDKFRVNIARKNIVNFYGNWAEGLSNLVRALERDHVPKKPSGLTGQLVKQVLGRTLSTSAVEYEPESLLLNWIEVRALPTAINYYRVAGHSDAFLKGVPTRRIGIAPFGDGFVSFTDPHRLEEDLSERYRVKRVAALLTEEFLKGSPPELPHLQRREAQKIIVSLFRQSWDINMQARGLRQYTLANGTLVWYPPKGLVAGNAISYMDLSGRRRRKALMGYSGKRGVYWHFAVETRFDHYPRHVALKPHVVFTTDGEAPVQSTTKMHAMRRGFCRSWWNDRWRDLLSAYLKMLSSGSSEINLDVGSASAFRLSDTMITAVSKVRLNEEVGGDSAEQDIDSEIDEDIGEEELHGYQLDTSNDRELEGSEE